jgi:hypothetical protein
MIKYEVRPVVCDYGVYEDDKLICIVDYKKTADLIKDILEHDANGYVIMYDPDIKYLKIRDTEKESQKTKYPDIKNVYRFRYDSTVPEWLMGRYGRKREFLKTDKILYEIQLDNKNFVIEPGFFIYIDYDNKLGVMSPENYSKYLMTKEEH